MCHSEQFKRHELVCSSINSMNLAWFPYGSLCVMYVHNHLCCYEFAKLDRECKTIIFSNIQGSNPMAAIDQWSMFSIMAGQNSRWGRPDASETGRHNFIFSHSNFLHKYSKTCCFLR